MQRKRRVFKGCLLKRKTTTNRRFSIQLYSPKEKYYNCIWNFILGDADDKPSVPHAHAQEFGYRLNAWTGEIYLVGNDRKRVIGNLPRKELSRLHRDAGFLKFAKKQIQWYQTKFPQITFFIPEWFRINYMTVKARGGRKEEEVEKYVFIAKIHIRNYK